MENSKQITKSVFKEKFKKILQHLIESKCKLEFGDKQNLTIFCSNLYGSEIESTLLKFWDNPELCKEQFTTNLTVSKDKVLESLKYYGIDCNLFGIPYVYKPKPPDPIYIPPKRSTNHIKTEKKVEIKESTPKIIKVKNFIQDRYEIRLDEVRNVLEVRPSGSNEPFVKDERFEANLTVKLMETGYDGITNIVKALLASDFVPRYHPIREYLLNLNRWDGIDRIKQLSNCLEVAVDQKEDLYINFKKHLLRCVSTVLTPDFFNKHCFVIIGTRQSMFKTSFIRFLCPEVLRKYTTDAILEWKDKDANIALGSNWIINLDELANLNRDETNSLKATLSRDSIKVRRPYDRVESEMPRLANFFGSTNDLQFLTDLTGNVRWICFRVFNICPEYRNINIDQLWSQVMHEFELGSECQLTREELKINDERNQNFMVLSPELEAIQRFIVPGIKGINNEKLGGLPIFAQSGELFDIVKIKSGSSLKSLKLFGQALQAAGFISVSERHKITKQPIKGYWYHEINSEIE